MRKRRPQRPDAILNICEVDDSKAKPEFQMDRLKNYAAPAPAVPSEPAHPLVPSEPAPPKEASELELLFQKIHDRVSADAQWTQLKRADHELADLRKQAKEVMDDIERTKTATKSGTSQLIWQHKQFFTEVIDFAEKASSVDLSTVKLEYQSLGDLLERLKSLRALDPNLYNESGISDAVIELFEFYAEIQTNSFSFKANDALVNLEWIQAGWFWTDDDLVPKVFEKSVLPLLLNRLRCEDLKTENDFRMAFLHCLEISDYCVHCVSAEESLFRCLSTKLCEALEKAIIQRDVYNHLMDEFGFQMPGWRTR